MDMLSSWWGGKSKTKSEEPKTAEDGAADSSAVVTEKDASSNASASEAAPAVVAERVREDGEPEAEGAGEDDASVTVSESKEDTKDNSGQKPSSRDKMTKEDATVAAEAALNSAFEFGSFLFKKVTDTATKTASIIQKTVEEQTIVGQFNKEQEKFMKEKHSKRCDAAVPPWVGYNEEEQMKEQILALSRDKRNFLRNPPAGVQFNFEFNSIFPVAMATLQEDGNLQKMRFELVPKKITEENFWRNYFYRVSLIKQSSQLTSLAAKTGDGSIRRGSGSASHSSDENSSQKGDKTPPIDVSSTQKAPSKASDNNDEEQLEILTPDSPPGSEFISDAFNSELDEADLKKGMEQLGMDKKDGDGDGDEDDVPEWEKELQQELQDFEVVGEEEQNEEWEREINRMLEDEVAKEK